MGKVNCQRRLAVSLVQSAPVFSCREPPISLDAPQKKFLTTSAPTGPPNIAPSLAQQGLQPIILKRQPLNPSRPVKNFAAPAILDDYTPVDGGHPPAHQENHRSQGIPSACAGPIRPEPVQDSGFGIRRDSPRQLITHWPKPGPAGDPANLATGHRLLPSSAGLGRRADFGRASGQSKLPPDRQPSHAP